MPARLHVREQADDFRRFYWAGVSRYRASGDAQALSDTAASFDRRYRDSTWAKKASVWKG